MTTPEPRAADTHTNSHDDQVISLWLAGRVVRLWLAGQLSAQQAAAELSLSEGGFADLVDRLGLTAWEFEDLSLAERDLPSVALSAEDLAEQIRHADQSR